MCAMNCIVCTLLLCALRRGGGGSGESEKDMTEMTSSGSGSQFLWRRGEDEEGEGRKRDVLDARRGGTRDEETPGGARVSGRFCHVAYMRTCRKDIEKHIHLYWFLIMRMIFTHLDVGGGQTIWDIPLLDPWSRSRSGPIVRISTLLPGVRCRIYFVFVITT